MNTQHKSITVEIEQIGQIPCSHADSPMSAKTILNMDSNNSTYIVSVNIRSINCNLDRFLLFLTELDLPIDVIVLSECRIDPDTTIPTIDGYNYFATHITFNQNDGVVVYTKNNLEVTCSEVTICEGNCLLISIPDDISIICTYRPSCFKNPKNYINSLNDLLGTITTNNIILTGDININILPKLPGHLSSAANDYLNVMAFHGLKQGIDKPTRVKACLDHFMVKTVLPCQTLVFDDFTDHSPILLKIDKSLERKKSEPITIRTIDYVNVKKNILELDWDNFYNLTDVNSATEYLINNIRNIITKNTSTSKLPHKIKPLKPWITIGMVKSIRKRDKLLKKLKKTPNDLNLEIEYKNYRNTCNRIIKHAKKNYYINKLEKSVGNNKETWKIIKELCNMTKNKDPNTNLLTLDDNPEVSLDKVNQYFTSVGNNLANQTLNKLGLTETDLIDKTKNITTPTHSMSFFPTDRHEVASLIGTLDSNSACGGDKITIRFLKMFKELLTPPIVFICNLSFATGVFPSSFKTAVVCPIHKAGDRNNPSNYRPISLLPTLSKIIEKLVNRRLVSYMNKTNMLSENQYGFRAGRSTEDAVLRLTSLVTEYLDKGDCCVGVFLDLQKAFDTVSIPILLARLESSGVRGVVYSWFSDYLIGRRQVVKVDNYYSRSALCNYGVPQGSTLGPTLFLIYINSLCNLNVPGADTIMFADDTVVLFHNKTWDKVKEMAEVGLCHITAWLEQNLLTINSEKTKFLCFSKTKANSPSCNLSLTLHTYPCNQNIQTNCHCPALSRIPTIRYLGVTVDDKLQWKQHLSVVSAKARKLIYIFKQLRIAADHRLLISTYKALCQCILTYCICIWGNAAKTHMIQLERAQRAVLKVALGLPYRFSTEQLYQQTKVLPVRKLYTLLTLCRFHNKIVPYTPLKKRRVPRYNIPITHSSLLKRHFITMAPRLYNKVLSSNKGIDITQMNLKAFKNLIIKWMEQHTYHTLEKLLVH